ncbi:MAG: DUF1289 domain-containing protein [Methylobacterium radiotolerans]
MTKISTPCVALCRIDHASGLCCGCGRSRSEIARWTSMSEKDRLELMASLPDRIARNPHLKAGPFVSGATPIRD